MPQKNTWAISKCGLPPVGQQAWRGIALCFILRELPSRDKGLNSQTALPGTRAVWLVLAGQQMAQQLVSVCIHKCACAWAYVHMSMCVCACVHV